MLIPAHPEKLSDIVPICLSNYILRFGYSIELNVDVGGFYPIRLADYSVLYCRELASAQSLLKRIPDSSEYVIRSTRFLDYYFSDDPHAFSLDDQSLGFEVLRVRLRTTEEVQALIDDGLAMVAYPPRPQLRLFGR